jgi:pimeloyl-ACP methyl ester carboxylesterase
MKDDKRTNPPEPSRRNFLQASVAGAVLTLGAGCAAMEHVQSVASGDGYVTTRDGLRLHYIARGSGKPLVLIPGWSQTAAMFREQLSGLSSRYQVIALDMRGHGESDKPAGGYRIARLAQDTHDALAALGLRDVALGGHSMGCAAWPGWSDDEKAEAGTVFDPKSLYDTATARADGAKATENFINTAFFTKQYPRDQLAWVLAENLKFPREHAAQLLVDHGTKDWRDVIRKITVPALVVGGVASLFNPKSQQWIARQIPGSRAEIFGEHDGGSHFTFLENPTKFNRLVTEFLGCSKNPES